MQINSLDSKIALFNNYRTPESIQTAHKENYGEVACFGEVQPQVSNLDIELLEAKIKVLSKQISSISSLTNTPTPKRPTDNCQSATVTTYYSPIKERRNKKDPEYFSSLKKSSLKKRSRPGVDMQAL